ncbi:Beta-1,4-galactosyltransferase 3 [Dermatophagoides farinae]|uniref:Beta-1,4-galactosyltransferase 3 n=1 Tax=Dermatophagoides farinae TaxID=6954 RepID=A0A922IEI8_DERFA|nr:Beta-1,4-galactosyltransferase 3 [Dermatophagoides farinae]
MDIWMDGWMDRRFQLCFIAIVDLSVNRTHNQTRTTSFSIHNASANIQISSDVGFGFCMNARSNETRTVVSILVRFLRRLPLTASGICANAAGLGMEIVPDGLFNDASASSSHRFNNGFNLHIFLKLRFNASKRDIVVWLKSLPYIALLPLPPVNNGSKGLRNDAAATAAACDDEFS